jgi:hypothetical protein
MGRRCKSRIPKSRRKPSTASFAGSDNFASRARSTRIASSKFRSFKRQQAHTVQRTAASIHLPTSIIKQRPTFILQKPADIHPYRPTFDIRPTLNIRPALSTSRFQRRIIRNRPTLDRSSLLA